MRLLALMILMCNSNFAVAGIDSYKCTVDHSATLHDNGQMTPSNYSKIYVGKEFVVDKGTGRISGILSNHNAYGQPHVLDYGSSEQAFKALTIYKPMATVDYLYIQEFNDNGDKPFFLVDGSSIFSGLCTPY